MYNNLALLDLGVPELLIILAILVLLFGGTQLPKLARALRTSKDELKGAASSKDDSKKPE